MAYSTVVTHGTVMSTKHAREDTADNREQQAECETCKINDEQVHNALNFRFCGQHRLPEVIRCGSFGGLAQNRSETSTVPSEKRNRPGPEIVSGAQNAYHVING